MMLIKPMYDDIATIIFIIVAIILINKITNLIIPWNHRGTTYSDLTLRPFGCDFVKFV